MRKEYPDYKRGDIEKVFNKLPISERKTIDEFISYCSIGAGENKLKDIQRSITQARDIIDKPFDKWELKDIRDYLALLNKSNREKWTTNGIKAFLKRFIRWKYKDWPIRFDNLRDIKMVRAFNEEKINAETLLKKEEIEKIMKAENKVYWKAFFITLYESGLRPCELAGLTWKNINFNVDDDLSEINVYATKTSRARVVYVKEATYYLKKLFEEKEKDVVLVFPSARDKNVHVSKQVISMWLKALSKKALGRAVNPYLLRHTRATELYTNANISPKVAQKFLGHGKDMSDWYAHLSSKDVKDAMTKSIYSLEIMPEKKKHELELKIEKMEREQDQKIKEAIKQFEKKLLKKIKLNAS